MIRKALGITGCFIAIMIFTISCREDKKITEKEIISLAQKSGINTEIKRLREKITGAKTDYQRAEIHTDIALLQAEKGNVREASVSALAAIKYQPNQYMSHYVLGKAYIQSGRYDDAEYHLRQSIAIKQDFSLSHFELGNTYYKKQCYSKAIAEYNQTLKYDSLNTDAMNNIGVLCNLLGQYKEAEKNFEKVIEIKPEYSAAYKNLAIINDLRLKNKVKAVGYYKKYLSLRPDCPERSLVKSWIQQLGGSI